MAMLCCGYGRRAKPVNTLKLLSKERYMVKLVCPSRTLGLELTHSERGPFVVNPVDKPAKSSEIKKGDVLVGIDDWFIDKKTSLDRVLKEVHRKMQSDHLGFRLILEREEKPTTLPETHEDAFDEKMLHVPEAFEPKVPATETPHTSEVLLENRLRDIGIEKLENIPDVSSPPKAEQPVNSKETKEVGATFGASEPNNDSSNASTIKQHEISTQQPTNGE